MAARAPKLSGKSGRKSDPHDARSVAIAAAHNRSLRRVIPEDFTTVIGLLLDRRWQLVSHRQRVICQLHAVLTDLIPAGAKTHLTCDKTVALLRRVRPVTAVEVERKHIAQQLLADWRWLNRRIPPAQERLSEAVVAHGTTLTSIYGIGDVGAATIIAIVGDVSRFSTAGHFAAFCGTAPLEASSGEVVRDRLSRRGDRQMNKVLHVAARCQVRNGGPAASTTCARSRRATASSRSCASSSANCPRSCTDAPWLADQAVRGGQVETRPKSA